MEGGMQLPPLLELHRMCRQRAPDLDWPLTRLCQILEDFPDLHWRMVAGRCLDYIGEREGVRDGPRTLRTFMEREQRETDTRTETPATPKPDTFVNCFACGKRYNLSAEVRRRLTLDPDATVSTCQHCYEENTDGHGRDQDHEEGEQRQDP